jgi:anti-sigma factor RsiW
MPGYMWKQDKNGHAHLEDSILLAYIRGQLAADAVLTIQQHCAKCQVCTQKCAQYTRISMTLQQNLTYAMPVYPSIVDMLGDALDNPAAASAALRQHRENRRRVRKQRARTSGSKLLRLAPRPRVGVFPLTVSVSLVMLMVLVAYMFSSHMGILARNPPAIKHATPPISSTLAPLPTATRAPILTKTVNASTPGTTAGLIPTGTATSDGTSKSVIWLCSSNADLAQSRLRICGKNFKAGDRIIILEVFPNISHRVGTVTTADAHGTINGVWTISNCRNVPIAVFAFNLTRATFTSPVSVNISIGGCRSPNVKFGGH